MDDDGNKTGYFYVMYNEVFKHYGDNVYKLGRSIDLKHRLCQYTTSYLQPSKFVFSIKIERGCNIFEQYVFEELKHKRMRTRREFFDAELEEIISIVKRCHNEFEQNFEKILHKVKKCKLPKLKLPPEEIRRRYAQKNFERIEVAKEAAPINFDKYFDKNVFELQEIAIDKHNVDNLNAVRRNCYAVAS